MGDVHGDLDAFEASLVVAGLVTDKGGSWRGGKAVLVQIGDVLDRGVGEVEILLRLNSLKAQARNAGGDVVCLVGNHEVMNYEGDFRYVSGAWGDGFKPFEDYIGAALDRYDATWRERDDLKRYPPHQRARAAAFDVKVPPLGPPGLIFPFRSTTQVAHIVGDTLFVHAGLVEQHLTFLKHFALQSGQHGKWKDHLRAVESKASDEVVRPGNSAQERQEGLAALHALNDEAHSWISQATISPTPPPLLTHEHGPVWLRAFSSPPDLGLPATPHEYQQRQRRLRHHQGMVEHGEALASSQKGNDFPSLREMLVILLRRVGCRRMVVGHTPQDRMNVEEVVVLRSGNDERAAMPPLGPLGGSQEDAKGTSHPDVASSQLEYAAYAEDEPDLVSAAASGDSYCVWRVDTGMSSGIANGPIEVLEILSTHDAADQQPAVSVLVDANSKDGMQNVQDGLRRVSFDRRRAFLRGDQATSGS